LEQSYKEERQEKNVNTPLLKGDKSNMTPKRNRNRQTTPVWVDTLITWLEFLGIIATILAGLYALVTWVL
jgi:hypothetical protein